MSKAEPRKYLHRLQVAEVETVFVQVPIDLHEIIVLDGIDELEDPLGCFGTMASRLKFQA